MSDAKKQVYHSFLKVVESSQHYGMKMSKPPLICRAQRLQRKGEIGKLLAQTEVGDLRLSTGKMF